MRLPTPHRPAAGPVPGPRRPWTLVLVCVTTFMLLLDVTVVSVALPDIQGDLNADLSQLQWVLDAYLLTLATVLLSAATAGDRFGRRRLFQFGVLLFTAGSLACAWSGSPSALEISRGVQGAGGAVLFGVGLPLLRQQYSGDALARAVGAFGASIGLATAVGPLIGGALTDAYGWRSIFLVNVPIGVLALLAGAVRLPRDPVRVGERKGIDWAGTLVFTGALFCLVIALIRGNPDGWTSTFVASLFAASAVLLTAFVAVERRVADPMIDLTLFARPRFAVTGLAAFVSNGALIGMITYLALYVQNVLGYSPFDAGVRFLPLSVTAFLTGIAAGTALLRRLPLRVQATACLAAVGGGVALMTLLTPASDWTALVPGSLLAGVGLGLGSVALSRAALAAVDATRAGLAAGVVNTLRQVGAATGVAALGALYQHEVRADALHRLSGSAVERAGKAPALADALASGAGLRVMPAVPAPARALVAQVAREATVHGLTRMLTWTAVVATGAAVLTALLYRGDDAADGVPTGDVDEVAVAAL